MGDKEIKILCYAEITYKGFYNIRAINRLICKYPLRNDVKQERISIGR